jgi:hypothetical protein
MTNATGLDQDTRKAEFAVWWTTDAEVCWLMQNQPPRPYFGEPSEDEETPLFIATFWPGPEYIRDQLASRNGRHGRGRLWVDESLKSGMGTLPGLPTAFEDSIDVCAGIIVRRSDLDALPLSWLGVATDLDGYVLRRHIGRWIRDERAAPGKPNPRYEEVQHD